ncbi:hypothetical protein ASPBRDRAFT_419138 [Aspergillus brasiliensis CBS 101740]|uniref:Uncharacterized protein n=1 Tax=Aspergillus brasiliensis (strain CBS 101740 / IMI 381727 / IBT 21946) TaxID=767769 RepID=A0A1L9U4C5_ASPBC|nr:hypothetical protein ASPBRDRAFT_419138 [Aspergillus brasiliensis CBS 101740]
MKGHWTFEEEINEQIYNRAERYHSVSLAIKSFGGTASERCKDRSRGSTIDSLPNDLRSIATRTSKSISQSWERTSW